MIAATAPLSPLEKLRLAGEVLVTYVRVRILVKRADLRTALSKLRQAPAQPEPPAGEERVQAGARLARAVVGTLPRLPVDHSCLLRSLTLSRLLARRGIDGVLVIAVEAPGQEFVAHAWVEVDGRALLDTGGDRYARLVDL